MGKVKKNEDWGILGKNDFTSPFEEMKMPMGFNMLFNSVFKNLQKQLKEIEKGNYDPKSLNKRKLNGISINISTSGNFPPVIRMNKAGNKISKKGKKLPVGHFSAEKLKKYSKLPREEPRTDVRRLSDKIVYEIELPGVRSIDDVSILNLENSMEIKAISDKKIYSKTIQMNQPIDYDFSKEKLILEFKSK